jgi:hypothetical protein
VILPRPFRLNAAILTDLDTLDVEYGKEGVSAQILVEIHYKGGVPSVVRVKPQRDYEMKG